MDQHRSRFQPFPWPEVATSVAIVAAFRENKPTFRHNSTFADQADFEVLVIGGGKEVSIAASPLRARYFQDCLRRQAARLVVIGYGFRDDHVNNEIIAAVNDFDLRFSSWIRSAAGLHAKSIRREA